jgi:hypothetical protein
MNLCQLKIYDFNSVNEEVKFLTTKHKLLMEDIDKYGKNETIKEICILQNAILYRIEEIKVFIERYSFDSRISPFIKANKSLNKLLQICKVKTIYSPQKNKFDENKQKVTNLSQITIPSPNNKSQYISTKPQAIKPMESEKNDIYNTNEMKEIMFKLKLTNEEYNLLLDEKRKLTNKK